MRLTRADLARAIRDDLVAMVGLLHAPPVGEVVHGKGATWFRTGLADPHANGVLASDLTSGDLDASIGRTLAPFGGLPLMWWRFVPPDPHDPAIADALARHGLVLEADRPGFGLDLARLSVPPTPVGAVVERVRDEAAFEAWVAVVGAAFGDPDFAAGPSVLTFRGLGFGDGAPFRHFVCRLDGSAVGAATLSLAAGVAGLSNIAVEPDARRRRIGSAVAAAALLEARALGVRVGALSADPLGENLYRKLGFREVSRHLTFVRPSEG